jgi:hypothetical protein
MNHLISQMDLNRIENSLLQRRDELVKQTSFAFNLVLLAMIIGSFIFFLKVQYETTAEHADEEKRIPFEPQTWYSATRNVRSEEYGSQLQPFEIETRYGLS